MSGRWYPPQRRDPWQYISTTYGLMGHQCLIPQMQNMGYFENKSWHGYPVYSSRWPRVDRPSRIPKVPRK